MQNTNELDWNKYLIIIQILIRFILNNSLWLYIKNYWSAFVFIYISQLLYKFYLENRLDKLILLSYINKLILLSCYNINKCI